MAPRTKRPVSPAKRMTNYRQRMRAAGLRPVQIWVPDTRAPDFAEKCRRQARAVATSDPAGDEIMHFVAGVYEWPER
ncbi:MAG: antitoxin MazE family protein [Methylovirgula sp.]